MQHIVERALAGRAARHQPSLVLAARQAGIVLALLVTVMGVTGLPAVRQAIPPRDAVMVLALAAVGVGVMSAVFAALLGRLIHDDRAVWVGVALALLSAVAVPASTLGVKAGQGLSAIGSAQLGAHAFVVVVLFVAVFRPELRRRCSGHRALVAGLAWVGVLATIGLQMPSLSEAVVGSLAVGIAMTIGGVVAGLLFAAVGWYAHCESRSWIGLGCLVIAVAYLQKLSPGLSPVSPEVAYSTTRLLGMTLVMVGLGELAVRALKTIAEANDSQEEELRTARLHLRREAERAHEVRNGLAGLAGATGLLVAGADDSAVLRAEVSAELARLGALLGPPSRDPNPESEQCAVEVLLREQLAPLRTAGMNVRLDVEPSLVVRGSRSMLAQVIANLLANCAAHAPGSPVRIQAARQTDTVLVRVSDYGPGIPEGAERTVFQPGARGVRSTGQGLGLHICQKLVEASGGTIEIRRHKGDRGQGCTVLLRLPAAEPATGRKRWSTIALAGAQG